MPVVLRQKLRSPSPAPGEHPRSRLRELLDQGEAHGRHVLLLAGAGYGKSSLLASWVRERPHAWVTLDAEDADLETLLTYWVTAFEQAVPGFRTEARDLLGRAREREGAAAAVSALIADLDEQVNRSAEAPLWVVFDNWHLASGPTADALVGRLMDYLPPGVRLALTSRESPDLNASLRQARGQLLVVEEGALAFDAQELASFHPEASPEEQAALMAQSGGWPAYMGMSPAMLEAHLREVVLQPLPLAARDLVQRLALVDSFDEAFVEAAFGQVLDPALKELLHDARLLQPTADGRWAVAQPMRAWLGRKLLGELGVEAKASLVTRVGEALWAVGQEATAVRLWLEGGRAAVAAERLATVAEAWLVGQRLDLLAGAISALGPEGHRPELLVALGEVKRRWGNFERAEALLQEAVEAYEVRLDGQGQALATLRLALTSASSGRIPQARDRLADALPSLPSEDRIRVDVLNLEGGLALYEGDTAAAEHHFEASMRLSRRLSDRAGEARAVHNLAICRTRQGKFTQALDCYDAAMALSGPGEAPAVWMTPINRALILIYLQRPAEAREAAEAALSMVRRYRLAREEGYALRILGFALLRLQGWTEAAACFEAAELLARRMNDPLALAFSLNFQAELAIEQGDLALAQRLVGEVGELAGQRWSVEAMPEFAQVRARTLLATQRFEEAKPIVEALLALAQRAGYRPLQEETQALATALEAGASGCLPAPAAPAKAPNAAPEARPPELEIYAFGQAAVWRHGVEVPDREFQSARARWLLFFLLQHPEGATKAKLVEALYPGEEPSDASVNMNLMRLRKALEPGLEKGQPSRYVLRAEGRYAFNRQASARLDALAFDAALKQAGAGGPEDQMSALHEALAHYRGEYLPGCDLEWAEALRQRYRDKALSACRKLLALQDEHQPEQALDTVHRALEVDPLSEEFHREAILRYLEAQEPHRALQHYELCERRFRDLLDAEPPEDLAELLEGVKR